jgi:hypothetical protein
MILAISESLFDTFVLYEQFVAASYCPNNTNTVNQKLVCGSDICPLIEQSSPSIVAWIESVKILKKATNTFNQG